MFHKETSHDWPVHDFEHVDTVAVAGLPVGTEKVTI